MSKIKMKRKIHLKEGCAIFMACYLFISVLFYLIAKEQITYQDVSGSIISSEQQTPVGEITQGVTLLQPFQILADQVDSITLFTATYDRKNTGTMQVELVDLISNEILATEIVDLSTVKNNGEFTISFKEPVPNGNARKLAIQITSSAENGNAVTIWQKPVSVGEESLLQNGKETGNRLLFYVSGKNQMIFGKYYFLFALLLGIILAATCLNMIYKQKHGKNSLGLRLIDAAVRYKFLLQQLVSRDFKTKYKRSVLGVLWSFLNPLLLMSVQYVVFSTIFKSDIDNFPVYLLSGIVFFNFFSEACSMTLMSIVGNASLITKVYVPKYIYPVSRVFSSTINLLLSFIPLLIVILFTGTKITFSYLLLPFGVVCIIVFCIGLGMLLSASMVFFRDTQFLWNVVSMLWMYATPIFYPEEIIPVNFSFVLKLNPLYHFTRFIRIVIMQGVSPEPRAYLFCFIFAFGMLLLGALVFKKVQNKFILYI